MKARRLWGRHSRFPSARRYNLEIPTGSRSHSALSQLPVAQTWKRWDHFLVHLRYPRANACHPRIVVRRLCVPVKSSTDPQSRRELTEGDVLDFGTLTWDGENNTWGESRRTAELTIERSDGCGGNYGVQVSVASVYTGILPEFTGATLTQGSGVVVSEDGAAISVPSEFVGEPISIWASRLRQPIRQCLTRIPTASPSQSRRWPVVNEHIPAPSRSPTPAGMAFRKAAVWGGFGRHGERGMEIAPGSHKIVISVRGTSSRGERECL